mmetsp:Transcript_89898/g.178670  ORF Transcript_89898/g.178670 Transcript_89898/m.178670 type:complete len:229 (+) Transcript_89898:58-744(+)
MAGAGIMRVGQLWSLAGQRVGRRLVLQHGAAQPSCPLARSLPPTLTSRHWPWTSGSSFFSTDAAAESTFVELEAQVAELKQQLSDLEDKRLSIKSDATQQARRHPTDLENEHKYGITKFAKAMLQTHDNLARASASVNKEELAKDKELKQLHSKVVQMQELVEKAFDQFKVKRMDCQDQSFDPQLHEAMFAMPMPGKEPNTIFHILEEGYSIHDRTLRAAKVGVVRGS